VTFSTREISLQKLAAAIAGGANAVRAVRDSMGYTVEELSLASGLAIGEIGELERALTADIRKLRRIAAALHLPQDVLTRGGVASEQN
jgi:transcriptional regulator with XRE-family HTH domain